MLGCLYNNLAKAWSFLCQDANAMVLCDRAAIKEILATKGVLGLGGGTWLKNATWEIHSGDLMRFEMCGTENLSAFMSWHFAHLPFAPLRHLCFATLHLLPITFAFCVSNCKASLCVMKRCVPLWASQRWANAIQWDVQLSVLRDRRPRDLGPWSPWSPWKDWLRMNEEDTNRPSKSMIWFYSERNMSEHRPTRSNTIDTTLHILSNHKTWYVSSMVHSWNIWSQVHRVSIRFAQHWLHETEPRRCDRHS